jgi:hypothetical protein
VPARYVQKDTSGPRLSSAPALDKFAHIGAQRYFKGV